MMARYAEQWTGLLSDLLGKTIMHEHMSFRLSQEI